MSPASVRPRGTGRSQDKRQSGFTLVEVMISAVIGTVVLLAVYQVLILNQRSFTIQSEQIRQRQTLRATLDVVNAHLATLSSEGGDLVAASEDSIRFRAFLGFGIICDASPQGFRVERLGTRIAAGDSILVFAENGIADPLDDTWLLNTAGTVDTTTSCPSGAEAYDVDVMDLTLGTSVRVGAPIRSFRHETLRLAQASGEWFLARSHSAGADPLVGPLSSPLDEGLHIEYLDSLGISVANPINADQIVVTARTRSQILGTNRLPLTDSAQARISLSN